MATIRDCELHWSLSRLSDAIQKKHLSPVDITRKLIKRIEKVNPKVNAYITVLEEQALEDAQKAEQDMMAGHWKGQLHGIPISLKDVIYTKDIKTTMGSQLYKNFIPDYDATVVDRLKQSGAIIIGKLNTHEFAYGPSGDRSCFGPVRNPYDLSKMSGGSSSGSAAALASLLCFGALGTDTGGSIRIPSSMCGVVGMKPTFGRISKYGVYPLSPTLDHIGPMTRTVRDNAILLNALAGYDHRDPYSIKTASEDFTLLLNKGIKGSIIGIPSTFYFEKIEPEVEKQLSKALEVFKSLGAEICSIDIQQLHQISLAQQIIIKHEAYAVHKKLIESHGELYDGEVKERLLTGALLETSEYAEAQQMKKFAIQEFNKAFTEVDVILTPTLPIEPSHIGQREVTIHGSVEHIHAMLSRFTGPTNLNGFPSLSIPGGFSSSGMPIGFQLIGKPFDEANLYRFAHSFEQETKISTVQASRI